MAVESMQEWRERYPYTNRRGLTNERLKEEPRMFIRFFEENPEAIMFEEYYIKRGITRDSFERWCKRNKELAQAREYVRQMIATRRELGMLTGKYKEKATMHMMHHYSPDWDKANRYWTEMKQPDDAKPTHTVIEVPVFTKGDLCASKLKSS